MEKQEGRGVLHPRWPRSELLMTLGVVGGGSGPSSAWGSCVYSDRSSWLHPPCSAALQEHFPLLKEATLQGGLPSVSRFELRALGWTEYPAFFAPE